jgi:hypothetical protein
MATDMAIRKQVISVIREIMSDPDAGLELRKSFKKRLMQSVRSKNAGRVKTLAEIKAKYRSH